MYKKTNLKELKTEVQGISNDFKKTDLSSTNASNLWSYLKSRLHKAVDTHIPSKTVSKRNSTPWINHTIRRLHKRRQRAELLNNEYQSQFTPRTTVGFTSRR